MSEWRRKALELLPGLEKTVAAAPSPMALWIDLHLAFARAHEQGDTALLQRILQYARWCWTARSEDAVTAVHCAFFEHLPQHPEMRPDIPSWFSAAEFGRLRETFLYHSSPEVLAEIARHYHPGAARLGR